MSNGSIYVNASGGQGGAGVMYEVDSLGNLIWGPYNAQSQKGFRYECDYPGIIALEPYMNTATTSCFTVTPSWDCNNSGVCYDPGTGSGQYSTQAACTAVCVVSAIQEHTTNKELLKVTDLLGRETKGTKNEVLFYIYDDGTVEKRIVIEWKNYPSSKYWATHKQLIIIQMKIITQYFLVN